MDTISNMFVAIKNAQANKKEFLIIPFSKTKMAVLEILKKYDYIFDYKKEIFNNHQTIKIKLVYENGKSKIHQINRISKPGRKIYIKKTEIPKVLNGYGIAIISTHKGIISNYDAKKMQIGGELIAEIW